MLISQFDKSTLFYFKKLFRYEICKPFYIEFFIFFFFFQTVSKALNTQTESISNYSKLSPTWKITSLTR